MCLDAVTLASKVDTVVLASGDGDFAVPWLISVGVFLGVSVITGVLNVIPGLGAIVGVFLNFYALIVAANLWAGGFNEASDGGSTAGRTGIEETPA